jgi:hypothetical protein
LIGVERMMQNMVASWNRDDDVLLDCGSDRTDDAIGSTSCEG